MRVAGVIGAAAAAAVAVLLAGCPAQKPAPAGPSPRASASPSPSVLASPPPSPTTEPELSAPPDEPEDPESAAIAAALGEVMRAHSSELADCQRVARAANYKVGGDVILAVKLGKDGKPTDITAEQNHGTPDDLLACATAAVKKWHLGKVGKAGDLVMLPIIFGTAKAQYAISDDDVPVSGPKGGNIAARVLVDPLTTPDPKLSLTRLSIRPRTRIPWHSRGSAMAIYVMHGQLKLSLPGQDTVYAEVGQAVYVPAGQVHALEALTGRTPGEFLQFFAPAGPEHSYRDPQDRAGTIVVSGKPEKATAPAVLARGGDAKPLPIGGGKGQVRLLLEQGGKGEGKLSLEHFTAGPGMSVPEHVHVAESEVLYVLEGEGTMTVGGQTVTVKPGTAVHIPAGVKHGFTVTKGPVVAIQSYGPAGPEQRFKQPPPAAPVGGAQK